MLNRLFKPFLVSLLIFSFVVPYQAAAVQLIPDCNPIPPQNGQAVGGQGETCGVKHIFQLLVNIYNLLLGLAAFVATFFIVMGAVKMFYWSFMEEQEAELKAAKHTISRAITGLVLIACAYLIVNTLIVWLGGGSIDTIFDNAKINR